MIISSVESLEFSHPDWAEYWKRFQSSSTLSSLIWNGLHLGLLFARIAVESELSTRSQAPSEWPDCPHCGRRYRSKGKVSRTLHTLIGEIHWTRRVGRCPSHCPGSTCVPLDAALGVAAHQRTGEGLKRLGVLLCIMLPYEMASTVLAQWSGLQVSDSTLWNWVQSVGASALAQVEQEVEAYDSQGQLIPDELTAHLESLCLAISADGVMAPFRPQSKTPAGKTVYKEVKIGLFARLYSYTNTKGKTVTRLLHRRVVAHLGDIHRFGRFMKLEAHRQSIEHAPKWVWICDGGKGFWGLFRKHFAPLGGVAILDFYHAAAHLSKAAKALFGPCSKRTQALFESWRHQLRHGGHFNVLSQLTQLINIEEPLVSNSEMKTLIDVQRYFQSHVEHTRYQVFDQQDYPLGSGMIKSACKWMIQQRFKGTGMRWSEQGFTHLLQLRVAWVNNRFDDLFPSVNWTEQLHSPKR